jgi:hypothetical protein
METRPKPDLWRQPVGAHLPEPRHSQRPDPGSGLDGREAGAPGAGEGSRALGGAGEGGRERQRRAARLYRQSAAASAARRHTRYGAWRRARISSYGCDKEALALRGGGAGRRVGVAREAGVAAVSYPATAPATVARGFAGEAATSPFDLVSIPAAWTPSTRPFDRDTGPSGDTARVTQSAAVCRHFPARASALHPNSRLCPTLTGAAIRRSA